MTAEEPVVLRVTSEALPDPSALRTLLDPAFPGANAFTEDAWRHARGGRHFFVEEGGGPICHAAVVERTLAIDAWGVVAGYVEAVATAPERRRQGHGTAVMRSVGDVW